MAPRSTTNFTALFESLIHDLRVQVAAAVDRTIADFGKRLARIERRLDQLDPENSSRQTALVGRGCALCERPSVARGLCSAHYQQWRYRERRGKRSKSTEMNNRTLILTAATVAGGEVSTDN